MTKQRAALHNTELPVVRIKISEEKERDLGLSYLLLSRCLLGRLGICLDYLGSKLHGNSVGAVLGDFLLTLDIGAAAAALRFLTVLLTHCLLMFVGADKLLRI